METTELQLQSKSLYWTMCSSWHAFVEGVDSENLLRPCKEVQKLEPHKSLQFGWRKGGTT